MSKVIRNTSGKTVRKGLAFATASSLAISMATGAHAQDAGAQAVGVHGGSPSGFQGEGRKVFATQPQAFSGG